MRQPLSPARAVLVLGLSLSTALPGPVLAQSATLPSNVVAALSLDPVGPVPGLPPVPVSRPIRSTARLTSGFVPALCAEMQAHDSPRLVNCWLGQFPHIASAIRWEFVGADGRTQVKSWPEWDEASQQAVRDAFVQARRFWADGLRAWPVPHDEPPINMEEAFIGDERLATVLDGPTAAWPMYTAQVGISLAAEIGRWLPWSLRSYDDDALHDLFDAPRHMYRYDANDGGPDDTVALGYSPRGTVTPAHPATAFRFLFENRIPAVTPAETIGNVLEWSRRHMQLDVALTDPAVGDELPIPHGRAFWQYAGKAPLARILYGTRILHPRAPWTDVRSWTHGCAMTTDAFVWLLRAVNIPVRRVDVAGCNHSTPYFSGENLFLSHADDPYDVLSRTGSFSAQLLLVPGPQWQTWFPLRDSEPWCWNVGRRVVDLNFRFPSDALVGEHCADVLSGAAHEESEVRKRFRNLYPQEQLESSGLWERLAERAETSTAPTCVAVREKRTAR